MDWKTKLADFIDSRLNITFKWGKSDCCLFAADVWKEICGIDIAEWFRGRYKSKKKAYELLSEFNDGGLSKTMTKLSRQYKLKLIKPAFAQNGDLCLIKTDLGDALAIFFNGKIIAQGPKSLVMLPKLVVKKVWRHKKIGE